MNKNYSAKRYFIFAFKKYVINEFKIMSKKYMPSIRELLYDYIDIFEDINDNREQVKLEKSRVQLLDAIKFFIENNILYKGSPYKTELETLVKQINNTQKNYTSLYNTCKSLTKKISRHNIYTVLISQVKTTENFIEVDRAIEAFISELLYDGYSLKYLDNWFNQNINPKDIKEENIEQILDGFLQLIKEPITYKYYVSILNCSYVNYDNLLIGPNLRLEKQKFEELKLINQDTQEDVKNYLQFSSDYNVFTIDVNSTDIYKGLEIIVNAVNAYFQIVKYVANEKKNILLDKVIVQAENGKYEKLRIKPYDEKIVFSGIESREKADIVDFIKYRDKIYTEGISLDEINNLQRALNIVKNQQDQLQENRLINLWSVLEYVLTFHEGVSIISKVKEIIPKIISLYIIKEKLNIFWLRLKNYKDKDIDIVNTFLTTCKKGHDDSFYDVDKIVALILNEGNSLITKFNFNDLIKKDIAEIGNLLTSPENRKKYIQNKHEEVYHDIVRIYRTRNTLIHSGRRIKDNLNYEALRLYQYNSSLLSLIIYYKNKNPSSTITEILNSITYTYNQYLETLGNNNALAREICKPKYLFLG